LRPGKKEPRSEARLSLGRKHPRRAFTAGKDCKKKITAAAQNSQVECAIFRLIFDLSRDLSYLCAAGHFLASQSRAFVLKIIVFSRYETAIAACP
jgi:hypothetical protein